MTVLEAIKTALTGVRSWADGRFVRTVNGTAPDSSGNVNVSGGGGGGGAVSSVNTKTGAVVLTGADINASDGTTTKTINGHLGDVKSALSQKLTSADVVQTLTSGTAIGSVGGKTLFAPAGGGSAGEWEVIEDSVLTSAITSYTYNGDALKAVIIYYITQGNKTYGALSYSDGNGLTSKLENSLNTSRTTRVYITGDGFGKPIFEARWANTKDSSLGSSVGAIAKNSSVDWESVSTFTLTFGGGLGVGSTFKVWGVKA